MSFLKRLLLCLGAVVAAGGILWCLDIHCLVKEWLGLPCPLCGTVRGIACLVQGNPVDALYWHPLFWLTPILMALAFAAAGGVFQGEKTKLLDLDWGDGFVSGRLCDADDPSVSGSRPHGQQSQWCSVAALEQPAFEMIFVNETVNQPRFAVFFTVK